MSGEVRLETAPSCITTLSYHPEITAVLAQLVELNPKRDFSVVDRARAASNGGAETGWGVVAPTLALFIVFLLNFPQ